MQNPNRRPRLEDLIQEERWAEAEELVKDKPWQIYQTTRENGEFVMHMLCKKVRFIDRELPDGELSDDEDDDDDSITEGDIERNRAIYSLASLIIHTSHYSLSPMRVVDPTMTIREPFDSDDEDQHRVRHAFDEETRTFSVLTIKDDHFRTPLHRLCSLSADPTMMRLIFDAWTGKGYSDFSELLTATDYIGCTPLHYIVESRNCPFSSLRMMLENATLSNASPENALMIPDLDGDLPIHWALFSGVSPRRLDLILSHLGETTGLDSENHSGALPLQEYYAANLDDFDELTEDEKQEQRRKLEEVLQVVCRREQPLALPLHDLCSFLCIVPPCIFSFFLDHDERSNQMYDEERRTPLHILLSQSPRSDERDNQARVLETLLEDDRIPCDLLDSHGRLPLHVAAASRQHFWAVEQVLGRSPSALTTVDPVTQLPSFALAAVDDNSSLSAVYFLLRSEPSIIRSMEGET